MKTRIENGTVIAWRNGSHHVIENGVILVDGTSIVAVGSLAEINEEFGSTADVVVDASGRLVIPGFVNTHLHVTDTPFTRGVLEEVSNPNPNFNLSYETLYRVLPAVRHSIDPEAQVIAAECAFAELARTGSTTVVELGYDYEVGGDGDISITKKVAETGIKMGLRVYSGPRFRAMHYGQAPHGKVWYKEYPNRGRDRFRACVDFCTSWDGRFEGRLRTLLAPGQIDTCDQEMLWDTREVADAHKLPIQVHAGQSPSEFQRLRETYQMTTVEYMHHAKMLGQDVMIGHGQVMTADGNIGSLRPHEVSLLRDSLTTVVHLPWIKARRGGVVNSTHKYANFGVRQSLGTDTFPFDMFNDMRIAATMCRIVERSAEAAPSKDVFTMATAGGADALGRKDLGRIAPNCKADIVFVRIDTFKSAPLYDPFKFLVLSATGEDVDQVWVDGKVIVKDGNPVNVNRLEAIQRLNEAAIAVRRRTAQELAGTRRSE